MNQHKNKVTIVTASDDRYAPLLYELIRSIRDKPESAGIIHLANRDKLRYNPLARITLYDLAGQTHAATLRYPMDPEDIPEEIKTRLYPCMRNNAIKSLNIQLHHAAGAAAFPVEAGHETVAGMTIRI